MSSSGLCAWSGTAKDFLNTSDQDLLTALTHAQRETGAPQLYAWRNSIEELRAALNSCQPEVQDCGLVLEYELPRSGGRRPDLIFLNNGIVLVIEFKNRLLPEPSDLDQVLGYRRDLSEYHVGCRGKELRPVLIPLGYVGPAYVEETVHVMAPKDLRGLIKELVGHPRSSIPNTSDWVRSSYESMPALVEAARLLFERNPLPRIRTAEAADIPRRVERMESCIREAIGRDERRLILLTGVPGSGKTLIGLQTAYSRNLGTTPVMLSGNGPLVMVLQYILNSKEFVQPLKNHLRDVLVKNRQDQIRRVVVFDEAQRAWDRDRVLAKHQGDLTASEPSLLLSIADRAPGGFAVVALMGEGQEIHAGEESGIKNWVDAVLGASSWKVLGPSHLKDPFDRASIPYQTEDLFDLTVSLRSRKAGQIANWTEALLDGRLAEAGSLASELASIGYPIRISRNLDHIRRYLKERFDGVEAKRTGLIASSKFRKLGEYGVVLPPQNFFYYGQWYEDPPTKPRSGSRLELAISEFGCQGLELDLPVLCWGPDLRWDGMKWVSHLGKPRLVKNPHQLRLNAYRVLLTRGRDGMLVFIPPLVEMDSTFLALGQAGAALLGEV